MIKSYRTIRLASSANSHVDGSVDCGDILIHGQESLVGVYVARECCVHVVLVEKIFHRLLHADSLHLVMLASICVVPWGVEVDYNPWRHSAVDLRVDEDVQCIRHQTNEEIEWSNRHLLIAHLCEISD